MSTHIAFPYRIDRRGRTATASAERHLHELIEQVLFTSPGERINRPEFGCGLLQLVYEPASDALTSATQMTVQGALQRWLGDRIQVDRVAVEPREAALAVTVIYRPRGDEASRTVTFEREV